MNPAIKKITTFINAKDKAQIVGGIVVIFFLISYIFYQFIHKDSAEALAELEAKVEKLNDQILSEQRLAKSLPLYRKEVRGLEAKLKLALQELPDKREIPELLSSVSTLAKNAGLEIGVFRPQLESKKDFYAEVPVQITVSGTFHQVATFFDDVGKLSRIVNINKISIHDPVRADIGIKVTADCVATTFRYLDDEERQKMSADVVAETSKKKRR